MIYYVIPPVVSTKGKCSQNIRIYELINPKTSAGFVHIYKSGTWTRKAYNRNISRWWRTVTVHNSLPKVTWYVPQLFSTLELATAYAILAYQTTYAAAQDSVNKVISNLEKSANLSAEAETFINAYPELFI